MSHLVIAPILIPAIVAPLIVLWMRHDLMLQRVFGFLGVGLQLVVAMLLVALAAGGETQVYALGDWPAPFGIVLVLDRLSALMTLVTAGLSLGALFYAVASGWDARGRHFHALFQFQLMGIMGAFLTGDLFNLFVFFEILLIASYGLMLHGGGPRAMRAGVQYVAVNLLGSTLFLFAVGAIYAATGTLNMADLGAKAGLVSPEDAGLLRVGGLVLLAVFGVKAALVPLHFWLPITYGATPAPVAALFAVMTKVGAYSILRVYTLIFGEGGGEAAWLAADWLMPAALITLVVGALGVLGARSLSALVSFSIVASMGTLLTAVGAFTPQSAAAALYYMIHSTFAGGALFLLLEQVACRRQGGDALRAAPPFPRAELVGGLFMAAAIAMAGMPPLSGFMGKLLVLDGLRGGDWTWTAWTVVLTTSLMLVVGFARAGSALFWGGALQPDEDRPAPTPAEGDRAAPLLAPAYLLAVLVGLTVLANPVMAYLEATAAQLYAASGVASAALVSAGGEGRGARMRRLFPHPQLTILIVAVWMLLLNGFSLGGLVLGVALGAAIPLLTAAWWPDRPKLRSLRAALGYIGIVLWDVVVANVAVARIVLFKSNREMKPGYIVVPLDLRQPEAITLLAGTITMTPGTVTAELSADGRALLVHALDAPDPDAVRDEIKSRYEARIKEIFE